MTFVSITRLRVRSWRFMPRFYLHTLGTVRQVRHSEGFRGGSLLADRERAFWTMTVWDDQAAMRRYMTGGPHLRAMPLLMDWCDEASVVHWTQDGLDPPTWREADARMRSEGRPSKVRFPAERHPDLSFRAPRLASAVSIRPA